VRGQRSAARGASLFALLLFALVASALDDAAAWPFRALDAAWNDALLQHSATAAPSTRTVVVDIDDASLAAVGQWPWPRYRVANLVDRVFAARPAAIGLDIVFPEPDRTSVADMQARMQRDFGLNVSIQGVPEGLLDNDGFLAERLARAHVVGASYLYFDRATPDAKPLSPGIALSGPLDKLQLDNALGALLDAPALRDAADLRGFINCMPDPDGVLRRLPLVLLDRGVPQPSLALAIALRAMGSHAATLDAGDEGNWLRVGSRRIPVDRQARALVALRKSAGAYPVISAVDILSGRVPASALTGRAVIIGSSAAGLHDAYLTGTAGRVPGVVLQAAMVDALLAGGVPVVPPGYSVVTGTACLLAAFCLWAVAARRRFLWTGAWAALLVGLGAAVFSVLLRHRQGQLVAPVAPVLVAAVSWLVLASIELFVERRRALLWKRRLEK
jgi:adenylate cyclase